MAVTARADDTLVAVVVAHIIPEAGYGENEFRTWCRDNLGKRGVPGEIRLHSSFPRAGSGRVILRDLG